MTGLEFKIWLMQLGISQKQCAVDMGVSANTVTTWVKNKPPVYVKYYMFYMQQLAANTEK